MMDGRMEARQVKRLKEMGDWLKSNGESIYGTRGGPFLPNEIFATTRKGNKIYLHVFENKSRLIELPFLFNANIKKAYFLNGNAVVYTPQKGNTYSIHLPDILPDANSSVIVLEFDSNVETLPVIEK
jgi:alpha-L-fucosidase